MKEQLEKVKQFRETFNLNVQQEPCLASEYQLLYDLMKEENEEYLEACQNDDLIELADALGDQLYILCGTILRHGLQHKIEEVFNEIHRSNMSKLGDDGKPIYREDGKVLKGSNYFKPDIAKALNDVKYYYLKDGDIIKEGDEYQDICTDNKWKVTYFTRKEVFSSNIRYPHRRRI